MVGVPEGFRVGEGDRGQRLDQFVQRALSALPSAPSRALVQRWILAGAVRVNGEARKPSDAVRSGDTVEVVRPEEPRSAATPEAGIAFDIVHVDDALVVVNKPAGLVVHPAPSCPSGLFGPLETPIMRRDALAATSREAVRDVARLLCDPARLSVVAVGLVDSREKKRLEETVMGFSLAE